MILRRPYALTTIGSWSLVFLAAFESLAVTTIMPVVTADLDGRSLYSLAFSATMAASVIAMVVTGAWADGRGPAKPLLTAIGLFAAGLAVAGLAPTMGIFITGRFLQGLGAGGITVSLYVLIARLYPSALHIKIFGAFASAWVLPSIVGPFVAGVVADALSWHWVFLGVLALVATATALVLPATRQAAPAPDSATASEPGAAGFLEPARVRGAVVLAVAVVALSYTADLDQRLAWAIAPVAVAIVAVSANRLVPAGTYRARRGLPAAVLLCGAAGAVFFGTEVYLPLLLQDRYGLPAWISGVTLTAAAVSWALASAVQARVGDRLRPVIALRTGAVLLAAGAIAELVAAGLHLPPAVVAAGWFLAGAGMGTLYPQISTLVLAYSEPGREGFNTAAKSITDAVGGSTSLALTGLLFATVTAAPFVAALIFTSAIALTVVTLAGRAGTQDREAATISS
ncbi:MFS transporter [Actinoplanes sp. NPDC049265]|uniref:MFS transporter n=1 Tax=Actinoplanes sp. NPDC049265 TaxID=3363902 RepID=UPI00372088BB